MKKQVILQVGDREYILGRKTWLMGVLNVTPDSFSDGGWFFDPARAIDHGLRLIEEGSDILDVGGESSRPGSDPVSTEEEIARVVPVIRALRRQTRTLISIDTTKADVSRAALDAGADIINDISAMLFDPGMLPLAAERRAPVILMHMQGTPKTMQARPHYDDVVGEVFTFLKERAATAREFGIPESRIIVDPGIGFGKRHQDNLDLIRGLDRLGDLGRPVLLGVSRKSFIGRILDQPAAEQRLEGTIASSVLGALHGAHILRVHDVAAVLRAVRVAEAIMETEEKSPTRPPSGKEERSSYAG